jgi:hypothetical protein
LEGIPHVGRRATEHYRTDDAGKIVKTLLSRKPNYSISESVARSFPYKSQALVDKYMNAVRAVGLPE